MDSVSDVSPSANSLTESERDHGTGSGPRSRVTGVGRGVCRVTVLPAPRPFGTPGAALSRTLRTATDVL